MNHVLDPGEACPHRGRAIFPVGIVAQTLTAQSLMLKVCPHPRAVPGCGQTGGPKLALGAEPPVGTIEHDQAGSGGASSGDQGIYFMSNGLPGQPVGWNVVYAAGFSEADLRDNFDHHGVLSIVGRELFQCAPLDASNLYRYKTLLEGNLQQ